MSLTAAHLDALILSGATAEQIVALVKADMAEREAKIILRRVKDADRQRRQRSRGVTQCHADTGVTDRDPFLDKKVSQTLPKIKPNQSPPIIPQILEAWNGMAAKHGLPQAQGITGKREKALMARIGEHGFDAVLRAISSVPNCPHWLGENGWLGNLDSLLRPDNFQRMLEGAYAGKAAAPKAEPLTAEQWEERAAFYDRIEMKDNAEECRRKAAKLRREVA